MTRSSLHKGFWLLAKGSSSSRHRPPGWPGCGLRCPVAKVDPGQRIVIPVPGHGLKDIDTALSGKTIQAEVVAADLTKVAGACGLAG